MYKVVAVTFSQRGSRWRNSRFFWCVCVFVCLCVFFIMNLSGSSSEWLVEVSAKTAFARTLNPMTTLLLFQLLKCKSDVCAIHSAGLSHTHTLRSIRLSAALLYKRQSLCNCWSAHEPNKRCCLPQMAADTQLIGSLTNNHSELLRRLLLLLLSLVSLTAVRKPRQWINLKKKKKSFSSSSKLV